MPKASNEEIAKFALECREVRMLIAKNPGITTYSIKRRLGLKSVDEHLMKMHRMAIIRPEYAPHSIQTLWYVNPQ